MPEGHKAAAPFTPPIGTTTKSKDAPVYIGGLWLEGGGWQQANALAWLCLSLTGGLRSGGGDNVPASSGPSGTSIVRSSAEPSSSNSGSGFGGRQRWGYRVQ